MGWGRTARLVVVGALLAGATACTAPWSDTGPGGSTEPATLVVREDPQCNVALAEEERHGRRWYSKATVGPADHPPGEVRGELRFETDETAVFTGGGLEVWFGSYEYWEISGEPGARGPRFPTADCPITTTPSAWRPPPGGL